MLARPLTATFYSTGGRPQCAPDPAYPNGLDLDVTGGAQRACKVDFEYPAPSVGSWLVECEVCQLRVVVTAASRPDDPRSLKLPCKLAGAA